VQKWVWISIIRESRITTPGGKIASNQLIRNVPIKLGSKIIKTNLILLALEGIDIILGVDWMT
jgi:hypothetical protein